MSLISNLVVGLQVQTGGMQKGFKKGIGLVTGFVGDVVGKIGGVGGALAGLAGVGSAGAIVGLIHSSMLAIDELGASASKLGVTSDALSSLSFAAVQSDTSVEALTGGLQKLNAKLGDATTGGKASADAFKQIGLDAGQLSQMGATEAFKAIATEISGIADPAQRATVAMAIFGKSGQELLPLLSEGASGIEALEARAQELGLVMNDTDVQKVKAANDAIDELTASFTGVFNIVAIQLAPVVEHFAKQITDSGYLGQDAAKWIVTGLEWVTVGIGYVIDATNMFMGAWYLVKGSLGAILTGLSALFTGLIMATVGGINWLLESIGADKIEAPFVAVMQDFTKALAEETGQAFKDADKAFSTPSAANGAKKFFADIQANATTAANAIENKTAKATAVLSDEMMKLGESIQKLTEDWKTQIDTMGMSSREAEIWKLKNEGATDAQIEALKKLDAELTASEDNKKMKEDGKALAESLATPLETFRKEQEKFQKMLNSGAIDQQTFDRANAKAFDTLNSGGGADTGPSTQLAGAADKNSVEAFQILSNASAQSGVSSDPMDRLAQLQEKEFTEQKKQTVLLRQLAGKPAPAQDEFYL